MNILLLGSNERSALSFARSLRKELYNSLHLCRSTLYKNVSCYSKHIKSSTYINTDQKEDSIKQLCDLIKSLEINALVIFDDNFATLVYENYDQIKNLCEILGPKKNSWDYVVDKFNISRLCDGVNLLFPESMLINAKNFDAAIEQYDYFKPRFSSVAYQNKIQKFSVKSSENYFEKKSFIHDHINKVDIICQKKIIGDIIGINILAKNGQIKSISCNKRLHQPRGGGGSSYRESFEVSQQIRDFSQAIVKKLDWHGVMMIEVLKANSIYYLIEINPRFWGSLSLTLFSGHDICNKLLENKKDDSHFEPQFIKVRTRHILKDLLWLKNNFSFSNLFNLLSSPVEVLRNRESWDVESLSDPLPALMQFYVSLKSTLTQKIFFNEKLKSMIPKYREEILRYTKNESYIFLCKGNINRSVYCEYYLKSFGFENVSSCGYLKNTGRKVSPQTSMLLTELSSNHLDHSSKSINEITDKNKHKIIAMDKRSYEIAKSYGFTNVMIFSQNDIIDPHGKEENSFLEMKSQIENELNKKIYS